MSDATAPGAVWAVVLAAGRGRRFGSDKMAARLAGRPLLDHTLDALATATESGVVAGTVVVVAAGAAPPEAGGRVVVENPDPKSGLSGSLRLGISQLDSPTTVPRAAAALIVLGDQPMIRPAVIYRLIEAWRAGESVVRPCYADDPDAPGHPVVIDRSRWDLVHTLEGDRGLGTRLKDLDEVATIAVGGCNPDIDTPADLAELEGQC